MSEIKNALASASTEAVEQIKILFVEDSEDDSVLLLRELQKGGMQIVHKRVQTRESMRLECERESWDIILCDYTMPGFSGLAALDLIRELGQDIPAIIVSGTMGEEAAVEAMLHGARDYIIKNRIARLIPAIKRELQESRNRKHQKDMEKQLLQLQKMDAIGRLAGGIAHDFNNILGAIGIYCDLGLDEVKDNEPLRQTITEIKQVSDRAAAITRQLLLFSRKQVFQPKSIHLNEVIMDVEKILRRLIGENITLEINLAANLGYIQADAVQMEQVIINLAVNARDAMPQGGDLTIETSNSEFSGNVTFGTIPVVPGPYVLLRVSDTGIGMDHETLGKIFEPFFTTKEVGKGTGLGLSTTYGIVKESKGTIAVSSIPGSGTEFCIYLPRTEMKEAYPESKSTPTPLSERKAVETVLLVEDDPHLRDLCVRILTKEGFQVLPAINGKEALVIFESNSNQIDVLVTDVIMPEMGGFDIANRALSLNKNLRILFMSGYTDDHIQVQSPLLGQNAAMIEKPFSARAFIERIKEVLNH